MSAGSVRIAADVARLQALAARAAGRIVLAAEATSASPRFLLELRYTTAGSREYPRVKQPFVRLAIDLPARYPFQPPVASIRSPIFHPNVFDSGLVCQGTKWLPSEGMDLFVRRVAKLLTFDPLLVNAQSAATGEAMRWYVRAVREHPQAFPSDTVAIVLAEEEAPKVQWQTPERVLRACPKCATKMRLPAGKVGSVACPNCGERFEAQT